MDIKQTENLIEQTLNSQKPNKSVLSAAKEEMAKNKPNKRIRFWYYALSSCASVLIIVGAIIAILNPIERNDVPIWIGDPLDKDPINELLWVNVLLAAILIVIGVSLIITFIVLKIKNKKETIK